MEEQLPYNPNQNTAPSVVKPAIKMAVMIGGAMILYTLILYATNQGTNKWLAWINYALIFSGLILATMNFRDKEMNGHITFGKAFYFGFMIVLFTGILFSIYFYIHLKFIAHDLIGQWLRMTEEEMMKKNLPDDQIQQALSMTKKFMVPGAIAIFSFIGMLFWGSVMALISAAIAKRNPPPTFPPAA